MQFRQWIVSGWVEAPMCYSSGVVFHAKKHIERRLGLNSLETINK